VSKRLVSSTVADFVIERLTAKLGGLNSHEFSAGETGQILTSDGKGFSVGQAPGHLQSKACDMVLARAKLLI
jgi:hypothetical protein